MQIWLLVQLVLFPTVFTAVHNISTRVVKGIQELKGNIIDCSLLDSEKVPPNKGLYDSLGISQGESLSPLLIDKACKRKNRCKNMTKIASTQSIKHVCSKTGVSRKLSSDAEPKSGTSSDESAISTENDIELGSSGTNRQTCNREEDIIDWENFDRERLKEMQRDDPVLKKLCDWKESGTKPEWSEIADQGLEIK